MEIEQPGGELPLSKLVGNKGKETTLSGLMSRLPISPGKLTEIQRII
jgi:hypothetical protein